MNFTVKNKALLIIALIFNYINVVAQNGYAKPLIEDRLWIEFGDEIKNLNGSVIQPLFIHFSNFPESKKSVVGLEKIEAIYTFGEKDKNNKDIFYKLNIEMQGGRPCVRIVSRKETWCMVLIMAERKSNKLQFNYFAKTSFFLFGRCFGELLKETLAVTDNFNYPLDIQIYRERIKGEFTYNRKKLFPVRIMVNFNKRPLIGRRINIADELKDIKEFKTDMRGSFVYFSSDEEKAPLEKNPPFGHNLVIAEYINGDKIYKATYTIPFGMRISPLKMGGHNIKLGTGIFIITSVITFVISSKRRRKNENL